MKLLLVMMTMISCWSFEVGSTSLFIWNQKFLCKTALFFRRKVFNLTRSLLHIFTCMCGRWNFYGLHVFGDMDFQVHEMCPRVVDESLPMNYGTKQLSSSLHIVIWNGTSTTKRSIFIFTTGG